MTKSISIHEGLTYEFLVHGLFVLIGGGVVCFFSVIIGIPVMLVGFCLMVLSTGIEVDISNQRIRKYKSVLFIKFGAWTDLRNIILVELKYNANAVKTPGFGSLPISPPFILPGPGAAAKTFDLSLTNDLNEKVVLNQFLKITLALKTLKALEAIGRLRIINHVEQTLFEKRATRRR